MQSEEKETKGKLNSAGLSRRDFLKGSALGVAALGTLTGCAPKSSEPVEGTETSGTDATARPWEVIPDPIPESEIVETIEADVVIAGAGIAGANAASAAAREGAKVVVLEKASTFTYHGMDNGAVGSKWQKEQGIDIDRMEVLKLKSEWDHHKLNQDLFKVWLYRSGDVFDEVIDIVEAAGGTVVQGQGVVAGRDKLEPYYRQYATPHSFDIDADPEGEPIFYYQKSFVTFLVNDAIEHGAEFYYETPAVRLLTDDSNAVTGVIAQTADGSYKQFNASKGVILATGDIGGNPEMLETWSPLTTHGAGRGSGVVNAYTPMGCNTGDAITMGMWIGAARQLAYPAVMVHGFGTMALPFSATYIGWMQVNKYGERFSGEAPNEIANANSMMMQPDSATWFLFDGAYADKVNAMYESNSASLLSGESPINEGSAQLLADLVESGEILKADTIEELAEQIGCPADTLKASVERYNEMCANGTDEEYGKNDFWMPYTSLETGPFYAGKMIGLWFVTIYGLHCDRYSRVLNEQDEVIPNLFAIGNAQGDFFCDDYPLITPGISHGRCVTFGQLVGKALAHGELYELGY